MSDLISRSALAKAMGVENAVKYGSETDEQQHNSYDTLMKYEIADYIEDAPAVDAVPVVHARWEEDHMDYKCSACGTSFNDDMFWIQGDCITPKYCPECGARMVAKAVMDVSAKMDGGAEA